MVIYGDTNVNKHLTHVVLSIKTKCLCPKTVKNLIKIAETHERDTYMCSHNNKKDRIRSTHLQIAEKHQPSPSVFTLRAMEGN